MKEEKMILLAEDDELLAALLRHRLEKAGYEVFLSSDGKEVKDFLEKRIPDIIICDIMMPYFSGMEVTDHVRNVLKSDVPIIIISSADNEDNVINTFELGANDFLSKPLSPSELLIRVAKELNTK